MGDRASRHPPAPHCLPHTLFWESSYPGSQVSGKCLRDAPPGTPPPPPPPRLQVTVMCGPAWKDQWAHHSFSGSCQSWKAYLAPGQDVSQVPAWRGERAGDDDRLGRGRDERVSAPRAPGFLLWPRPVCSAFLGSLGALSRALEKPRFTGAHLCTTTRVLERTFTTNRATPLLSFHFLGSTEDSDWKVETKDSMLLTPSMEIPGQV